MKRKALTSSKGSRLQKKQAGYQVWHFALVVPAIAITLQVMLGSLTPLPEEHNPYTTRYVSNYPIDYDDYLYHEHRYQKLPEIEILPLNLRGDVTGPILASVIKDYFPESTPEQANDLRDTMPPSENPRMIVILPKDDEPVF